MRTEVLILLSLLCHLAIAGPVVRRQADDEDEPAVDVDVEEGEEEDIDMMTTTMTAVVEETTTEAAQPTTTTVAPAAMTDDDDENGSGDGVDGRDDVTTEASEDEQDSEEEETAELDEANQESTETEDDTNEGEESSEMPSTEAETTTPTEKTEMMLSDVDEDTSEPEQSDEGVNEPRSFPLVPEEEETEDDHVVIEAKDNEAADDDEVVIEAKDDSGEEVSYGIPPSSFWLWNGAPVFNPFVDNAIDREGSEGTDSDESVVPEPEQQASPPASYTPWVTGSQPTVGYSFSVEYDGSQFHHNVQAFPGESSRSDVASSQTAALPRWQSPAWTSASPVQNTYPQPAPTVRQKAPQHNAHTYYGFQGSFAGQQGLNPYFYYAPYQSLQG